jgi:hypothetical protein
LQKTVCMRAFRRSLAIPVEALPIPTVWWNTVRWGTLALLLVAGCLVLARLVTSAFEVPWPVPPIAPDPVAALTDRTAVRVHTSYGWRKHEQEVTADRVLHDRALWRDMRIEDWDVVPARYREPALRLMLTAYAAALGGAGSWRRMSVEQWDLVPQPVRAIAYLRMVWYWSGREQLGVPFGLTPRSLAPIVAAIVMSESWFEHRAVNENAWGNRDLGLAQCSDYCRAEVALMAERGEIGLVPREEDYFDPFVATRIAVIWYARELANAEGDPELAIRAYHRGLDRALDERGSRYLATVRSRLQRYIRQIDAPPTGSFIAREGAALAEES